MRVYVLGASYWCEDCIRDWLLRKDEILIRWPDWYAGRAALVSTEDMLREYLCASGYDPDASPRTWNSDKFPHGPYENGGGESDNPQHCDCCECFLENPLTDDGYQYVLEQIQQYERQKYDAAVDGTPITEWRAYYGDDHFGEPPHSINDVLSRRAA